MGVKSELLNVLYGGLVPPPPFPSAPPERVERVAADQSERLSRMALPANHSSRDRGQHPLVMSPVSRPRRGNSRHRK